MQPADLGEWNSMMARFGPPDVNVGFLRVHEALRARPVQKDWGQEARWRRVLAEVDPVMMPLLSSPHATWQFNL